MPYTLAHYQSLVLGKTCRWCNVELPARVDHYTHAGGTLIADYDRPQWLYVTCEKCGYEWALWKLGIDAHYEAKPL